MPTAAQHVLVYDVGGSHISAAVCASQTYELSGISHAQLPSDGLSAVSTHDPASPAFRPAFRFVRLIHALSERAAHSAHMPISQIAGAALAMPGPFDYQNGVSQMRHKLQSLYGVDLKAALSARFEWQKSQIGFVNDAAAFLLGEAGAGAAKGFPRSIGITLGTGIGCAFAVDSRIALPIATEAKPGMPATSNGVPPGGEIWNLPYNGATVEDFVSTRFLRARYQSLSGLEAEVAEVAAIAQCRDDQPCTALDETLARQPAALLSDHAATGAPSPTSKLASTAARKSFEEFGRHLASALNEHAAPFAPDVIVLGGGISRASSLFLPAMRKALSFPVSIAISALMDKAPLAGAGFEWFNSRPS